MFKAINKFKTERAKKIYKQRQQPDNGNISFPWNNQDFDYQQLVANEYTPKKLGFSSKPTIDAFTKDIMLIPKYPELLVTNAIPSNSTKPGISDVDPNNKVLESIKLKSTKFKEPYPGFINEYPEYFPLTGEKSSSYFLKVGTCPVKVIKDKNICLKRGFNWIPNIVNPPSDADEYFPNQSESEEGIDPQEEGGNNSGKGNCYKPRYMYINNQPINIPGMKGLVTSISKDIVALNPMGLIGIFTDGKSSNKNMVPLPCREGFQNKREIINWRLIIILFIFTCIVFIIILLMY